MRSLEKPTRRKFAARAAVIVALPGIVRSATAAEPAGPAANNCRPRNLHDHQPVVMEGYPGHAGARSVPPLTVHLPIQPVHSRDFIRVDSR